MDRTCSCDQQKGQAIVIGKSFLVLSSVLRVFSAWSLICVLQDLDRCVTVFKAQDDSDQPWVYIGKQRAHYKKIQG